MQPRSVYRVTTSLEWSHLCKNEIKRYLAQCRFKDWRREHKKFSNSIQSQNKLKHKRGSSKNDYIKASSFNNEYNMWQYWYWIRENGLILRWKYTN